MSSFVKNFLLYSFKEREREKYFVSLFQLTRGISNVSTAFYKQIKRKSQRELLKPLNFFIFIIGLFSFFKDKPENFIAEKKKGDGDNFYLIFLYLVESSISNIIKDHKYWNMLT